MSILPPHKRPQYGPRQYGNEEWRALSDKDRMHQLRDPVKIRLEREDALELKPSSGFGLRGQ